MILGARLWPIFAAALAWSAQAASPRTAPFRPILDEPAIAQARFGNDAPWFEGNIPFFDSSDPRIDDIYYYRWKLYRAHQRDLGARGYITTEFLDDVGWQREPFASLNDASGFHIGEGRWLRDRRYVDDYIDFLYEGGGNDRHFSEAIADATYARFLADGDAAFATKHLAAMRHIYNLWDDHFDFAKRLYWIEPLLDATEYTIASIDASGGKDGFTGGQAFRPSINSYMYANARAISRLAALAGDKETAARYAARARDLRDRVEQSLWSAKLAHFIDRYQVDNAHVHYWQPIRGRELVGYLPWTFELPVDDPAYAQAWRHILNPDELAGPAGLRTVEPSYQYYMRQYRYDQATGRRECQWNGPVWPFQTTQVLIALANLLNDYHQNVVSRSDYMRLLRQYTRLHFQNGKPDLEEDYDPATGTPIVGLPRSHHYFHSGYADLIVTGLIGLRPRPDNVLEINPLVPADPSDPGSLSYFALQDVPYHGHLVTIMFDRDGSHYHRGRGLRVLVDGMKAASRPTLGKLTATIRQRPLAPPDRPIDFAVRLGRSEFPRPSASIDAAPAALDQAIDGRVWFFPEIANGWTIPADKARRPQWFAIDFGKPVTLGAAELAFFADGTAITAPAAYRLQAWEDGAWRDIPLSARARPIANGVTRASWKPLVSSRLRLIVQPSGGAARLAEIKLFSS